MKSKQTANHDTDSQKQTTGRSPSDAFNQERGPEMDIRSLANWAANLPKHSSTLQLRREALLKEQRSRGNDYVRRKLLNHLQTSEKGEQPIQRHPPGAGISVDTGAVTSEVLNPPPLRPRDGVAAPAQAGPTSETTTAGAGPSAAEGPTAPARAPASTMAMDATRAQSILQTAYGHVHRIIPVTTILLEDNEATWTRYDEINRGRTNIYVTPNRPWRDGDARTAFPSGLNGFADGGTIYVNKRTTSPTTTCHEMLHSNTAADFRGKVGEAINEGTTQYLTIKALAAAGVAMPAALPYATQVGIVRKLVRIVGEEILTSAYFGGADPLIETYNLVMGPFMFAILKAFLDAQNWTVADIFLQTPTAEQRILAINTLLNGWVSDEDLNRIESIFNAASGGDKTKIRTAIRPRITELWDLGQRMRLRIILGTI